MFAIRVQELDKYIVNVSAMEGKFYRYKGPEHPHTNMAKVIALIFLFYFILKLQLHKTKIKQKIDHFAYTMCDLQGGTQYADPHFGTRLRQEPHLHEQRGHRLDQR